MALRRLRRKLRCLLRHGPRGCPHIERHTRRPKVQRRSREGPAQLSQPIPVDRPMAAQGRHSLH